MPKHAPFRAPRPYPEILAPTLSSGEIAQIRAATAVKRHSVHNATTVPSEKNRWGQQGLTFWLTQIKAQMDPFEGVNLKDTYLEEIGIHVLFEGEKDEAWGAARCEAPAYPKTEGILVKDAKGRGWLCRGTDGEGKLKPVSLTTAPAHKDFFLGGRTFSEVVPLLGHFDFHGTGIGALGFQGQAPKQEAVDRINARLSEILTREAGIEAIASRVLTVDALRALYVDSDFPMKDMIYPSHDEAGRRAFEDRSERLAFKLLSEIRDAGYCAPCPNDEGRNVYGIGEWAMFLKGELDGDPKSLKDKARWARMGLDRSPAFHAFMKTQIHHAVEHSRLVWERENPGEKYGYKDDQKRQMSREDVEAALPSLRDALIETYAAEEAFAGMGPELRGEIDGLRYEVLDSFLRPVLTRHELRGEPAPSLAKPKVMRHMTLTLPTGRLAMADWFRVKGFTKGIEALAGERPAGFDINAANGRDERAEAYYTKAGVVIVQVGNSSPRAYADTPGVWRMGWVNEDHEAFWDPKTQKKTDAYIEPVWNTCTDLWANTFAAPETIVDVMMASGEHESREAAMAELVAYCESSYGAHIVDLGTQTLNVYAPTGYAENSEKKMTGLGLKSPKWRYDHYVLSDHPLKVKPGLLTDVVWEEGRVDPEVSKRNEDDAPSP